MAPQPPRPPRPVPPRPPKPPAPPKPPKQRYRLLEDCRSFFKTATLYGKRGDVVTEVSTSDPVVIVEAASGERYPIHKSKLNPL